MYNWLSDVAIVIQTPNVDVFVVKAWIIFQIVEENLTWMAVFSKI